MEKNIINDDCWRKIGVSGDSSCDKLSEVIHCRNCNTFTAAGRLLLDREPSSDYQNEWMKFLAEEMESQEGSGSLMMIFRIASEWLAMPVKVLNIVTEIKKPHRIPHRGGILDGIINIEGQLYLSISLERLLNISVDPEDENQSTQKNKKRLVVIERNNSSWAFAVDEILQITRVNPKIFNELPVTVVKSPVKHVKATVNIDNKHIGVLDENLIFEALNRSLK